MGITTCPHCGNTVAETNFCSMCGGKLVMECDCPFLGKHFNCGHAKCPGVGIHIKLLRRQREAEHGTENVDNT